MSLKPGALTNLVNCELPRSQDLPLHDLSNIFKCYLCKIALCQFESTNYQMDLTSPVKYTNHGAG